MFFQYDGLYLLVFSDGIKFEVQRDLWERLRKLKEAEARP